MPSVSEYHTVEGMAFTVQCGTLLTTTAAASFDEVIAGTGAMLSPWESRHITSPHLAVGAAFSRRIDEFLCFTLLSTAAAT
jgi:hypothetical protein